VVAGSFKAADKQLGEDEGVLSGARGGAIEHRFESRPSRWVISGATWARGRSGAGTPAVAAVRERLSCYRFELYFKLDSARDGLRHAACGALTQLLPIRAFFMYFT
jgi:hypothetical protein